MSQWDRAADREQVIAVVRGAITAAEEGDALFGVTVSYGTPKTIEIAPADWFIVGDIRGGATTAGMSKGTFSIDDSYTLEAGVQVNRKAGTDGVEVAKFAADARCMAIVRAVFGLLFVEPRLNRGENPNDLSLHPADTLTGPTASSQDGVSVVSVALLDIECSRSLRGAPT